MNDFDDLQGRAEKGDARAQLDLARVYHDSMRSKIAIAQAVVWFRKAADQGLDEAQYQLGLEYQFGRGVEKNIAEAMNWLRKAAEQGHDQALMQLAWIYRSGREVEQDGVEASKLWRQAADRGSAVAQYSLGKLYAEGASGIEKDYVEAVKWLRMAAEQGQSAAQYNLGGMYAEGHGVEKDEAEAVKWFEKAVAQGYAATPPNLHKLHRDAKQKAFREAALPGQDLGAMIKANPHRMRILQISRVEPRCLSLRLIVLISRGFQPTEAYMITCFHAADYSIRPKNPNTMMGGPLIEFHEQHSLLEASHLQAVPGGDGQVFWPPLNLKLLILDQSHVIAERFEIRECVQSDFPSPGVK